MEAPAACYACMIGLWKQRGIHRLSFELAPAAHRQQNRYRS